MLQGHTWCSSELQRDTEAVAGIRQAKTIQGAACKCRVSEPGVGILSNISSKSFFFRSLTGVTVTIPDSEMTVFQVDGGLPVEPQVANSVGVLYPAERLDFILAWPESVADADTELIIQLDKE